MQLDLLTTQLFDHVDTKTLLKQKSGTFVSITAFL